MGNRCRCGKWAFQDGLCRVCLKDGRGSTAGAPAPMTATPPAAAAPSSAVSADDRVAQMMAAQKAALSAGSGAAQAADAADAAVAAHDEAEREAFFAEQKLRKAKEEEEAVAAITAAEAKAAATAAAKAAEEDAERKRAEEEAAAAAAAAVALIKSQQKEIDEMNKLADGCMRDAIFMRDGVEHSRKAHQLALEYFGAESASAKKQHGLLNSCLVERGVLDEMGTPYEDLVSDQAHGKAALHDKSGLEALLRAALQEKRDALGNEHVVTMKDAYHLGALLMLTHRYDEAASFLKEAVNVRSGAYGEHAEETLQAQITYGHVLARQGGGGKAAEGEELLMATFSACKAKFGTEKPVTLRAAQELGLALEVAGKAEDAERLFSIVSKAAATSPQALALTKASRRESRPSEDAQYKHYLHQHKDLEIK